MILYSPTRLSWKKTSDLRSLKFRIDRPRISKIPLFVLRPSASRASPLRLRPRRTASRDESNAAVDSGVRPPFLPLVRRGFARSWGDSRWGDGDEHDGALDAESDHAAQDELGSEREFEVSW